METIADIRQLPELGTDTIHIWGIHVPDMLERLDALYGLLSADEQAKADRFRRESDRRSSIAARGALRLLLSGYTGIPSSEIEFHYSETGKPALVPQASCLPGSPSGSRLEAGGAVSFSVSHSGDWAVLAIGRDRSIGVDVEKIKRDMDVMHIAARYFMPEERALIEKTADQHATFFQFWARKEAYVKACGSALFRELSSFSVPLDERGEKDGWFFQRLEAGSNYAAAVVTDKELADVPCYDFGGLKWDS